MQHGTVQLIFKLLIQISEKLQWIILYSGVGMWFIRKITLKGCRRGVVCRVSHCFPSYRDEGAHSGDDLRVVCNVFPSQ